MEKKISYLFFLWILIAVFSCSEPVSKEVPFLGTYQYDPENPIIRLSSLGNGRIIVENLEGRSVFLVKSNCSDSVIPSFCSGSLSPISEQKSGTTRIEQRSASFQGGKVIRKEHEAARKFNANPPISNVEGGAAQRRSMLRSFSARTVGEFKNFWVEEDGQWKEERATLRTVGEYCYIWVADDVWDANGTVSNENKVDQTQADALQKKFDFSYPLVTAIFGYENGGGKEGDGGVDKDTKISILIYDIDYDYTRSQSEGTLGFFWGKDFYSQEELDKAYGDGGYKTNEAEMFYIDAYFTNRHEKEIHSTLVHEFQHMIHFTHKIWNGDNKGSDTWYDEMLSMLCEDMMQSHLNIEDEYAPIGNRIPFFNRYHYASGITEWQGDGSSYATVYTFGAYLVRNYGGLELLQKIFSNNQVGKASITSALQELGMTETFDSVFKGYGGGIIHSCFPEKSQLYGGNRYIFKEIDLWEALPASGRNSGIYFFPVSFPIEIRPYGITIHSEEQWQDMQNDSLSLQIRMPSSSNVTMDLIIK